MESSGYILVEAWFEHCKKVGHMPKSEGGSAGFYLPPNATIIYCDSNDCEWKHSLQGDASEE